MMKVYHSVDERIEVLKTEVQFLKEKYESMDHDGGRFNTAAQVLQETIQELEFKESFRR